MNLHGYFKKREYPVSLINRQFRRALLPSQTEPKTVKNKQKPITMVVKYNPRNLNYSKVLHEIWKKHKVYLGNLSRPIVCFKRAKNLRDTLVNAKFNDNTNIPREQSMSHKKIVPLQATYYIFQNSNYHTYQVYHI